MSKYGSFFLPRGRSSGASDHHVSNAPHGDDSSHRTEKDPLDAPEDESREGGETGDAANDSESTSLLLLRHRQPTTPLAIDGDDDDDDDDGLSLPPRRRGEASRRRPLRRAKTGGAFGWWAAVTAALSLLATVLTLSLYEAMPSTDEMRLVGDYDLSYFDVPRLRSAQSLALQSASFLQDADAAFRDGKTVVHKITKHRSSSEHHSYMSPPEGCESTVVIVRHCEKGSVREHCAHVGFERAVFLSTLFGDHENDRWPSPSFIFAEGPGQRRNQRKMNFREMETVGPLADKVGVKVDDSYSTETVNDLSREILTVLQSGQMCGKVTLISWKHSNIAHLAHRLGCGPEQGCPMDYKGSSFDMAWQIKFTYARPEHSSQKDLQVSDSPLWNIAGSVQPEGFDPLAFSKRSGDYPSGGTTRGARWSQSAVSFPERNRRSHTQWKATRVGFRDNKKEKANDSGGGK